MMMMRMACLEGGYRHPDGMAIWGSRGKPETAPPWVEKAE